MDKLEPLVVQEEMRITVSNLGLDTICSALYSHGGFDYDSAQDGPMPIILKAVMPTRQLAYIVDGTEDIRDPYVKFQMSNGQCLIHRFRQFPNGVDLAHFNPQSHYHCVIDYVRQVPERTS